MPVRARRDLPPAVHNHSRSPALSMRRQWSQVITALMRCTHVLVVQKTISICRGGFASDGACRFPSPRRRCIQLSIHWCMELCLVSDSLVSGAVSSSASTGAWETCSCNKTALSLLSPAQHPSMEVCSHIRQRCLRWRPSRGAAAVGVGRAVKPRLQCSSCRRHRPRQPRQPPPGRTQSHASTQRGAPASVPSQTCHVLSCLHAYTRTNKGTCHTDLLPE